MKAQLRSLVRTLAGWPIIGRLVRIAVAVYRLPEQQHQHHFASEQLPALLATMSDLNARILAAVEVPENLSQSLPVTLRQLTRELAALRERLDRLEAKRQQ